MHARTHSTLLYKHAGSSSYPIRSWLGIFGCCTSPLAMQSTLLLFMFSRSFSRARLRAFCGVRAFASCECGVHVDATCRCVCSPHATRQHLEDEVRMPHTPHR
ncbi:hypothetical protein EON66_00870 [archaeon]|nr:MAG: hypothetical protein EON66_00870 [archaeon]